MKSAAAFVLAVAAMLSLTTDAVAFPEDGCEQQRKQYPKRWDDVSKEKPLFTCAALGKAEVPAFRITVGGKDGKGRTLISVVPSKKAAGKAGIYRMWLDREQMERLDKGEYFTSVVRRKDACWIRAIDDETQVLFMDNAPVVQPTGNATPRVSMFGNDLYRCGKTMPKPAALTVESCERQRQDYPQSWQDSSAETPLFDCDGRGDNWRVKLGTADPSGRSMMSLVRLVYEREGKPVEKPDLGMHRAWLDGAQAQRLREGRYFASPVRGEESCWTDTALKDGNLFVMDKVKQTPDSPDAGVFYNKAPRFGTLDGSVLYCRPFGTERE